MNVEGGNHNAAAAILPPKRPQWQSKTAVTILYVCEIMTINIRSYALTTAINPCTPFSDVGYYVVLVFQLIINAFAAYFLGSELSFRIPWATFCVLTGIIVINAIESVNNYEFKILGLFINLFGYFSLLRFWHSVQECAADDPVTGVERKYLAALHICFTLSILVSAVVEVTLCSENASLGVVESQLELFLLGYLGAIINWNIRFFQDCPDCFTKAAF